MSDSLKILSTNGIEILIDAEDLELVSQYTWQVTDGGYAKKYLESNENGIRLRRVVYMHRLIMNAQENQLVDHISQDKLDNRKSNLRFITKSLNALNSNKTRSSTGYRGVIHNKQRGKPFLARITIDSKQIYLGSFDTPEEASAAYLAKQKELTQ